ncbi:MAG: murein biosynthesis integral membrane protein MurJ [Anaerolineae bacterium]|nr:murein biosynthesis integral membrane protein MurJ [Anaerolineae bacterium]
MSTPADERVQVAQAAGVIALGNVFSRVLGLVVVIVKSGLFGAGPDVSALDAATRVPMTLYDLLVGGLTSSALVPVLSDYAHPRRREELWGLLSLLLSLASLLFCLLLLLGELFAPQLIWLMAGGLNSKTQALATDLLRLVLPAVLFLNLAGILTGALYALKRFVYPAFIAAVFNAALVVAALTMGRRWGVHSMAVGLVVGAILQVVLQLPGLRDARFRLAVTFRHPALIRVGQLYLPIFIGLVVDNLLAVVLSYHLASRIGEAAISWMYYSAQIIQFPLGLVATAVSIATLPTLSRHASAADPGPYRATLAQGLRLVLVLVIPATAGLLVLARPIVALVFEHGSFTAADTVAVTEALKFHLLGLVFAAVDQLLIFAFYARKDTLTPALVGVGANVFYSVTALTMAGLGILTLPLLILANSLKWAAHALTMLVFTRRRMGRLSGHGLGELTAKATLASLLMAAVTWGVMAGLLRIAPGSVWGELLVVGGAGGMGVIVYALLNVLFKMEEIHVLRAAVIDGWDRLTGSGPRVIIPPREEE